MGVKHIQGDLHVEGSIAADELYLGEDDSVVKGLTDLIGEVRNLIGKLEGGGADDSIVGTWVFNDELSKEGISQEYLANQHAIPIEAEVDGSSYVSMTFWDYGTNGIQMLICYDSEGSEADIMYDTTEVDGNEYGWQDESYKTIKIISCDDEILANWIRANATKQGGGSASAYTVSSVDELPSNAVDGSMAIVESDSIVGTWRLNDELPRESMPKHGETMDGGERYAYNVLFVVSAFDGICATYNSLVFDDFSRYGVTEGLQLNAYVEHMGNNSSTLYDTTDFDGNEYGWQDDDCRTIQIIKCDDEILANWIKANATRISGGNSLYIRENGEWVYKGEIT